MHNNITIDALKALDAIERKGSFASAAESLHKVPSALTYTIKKLEEELGTPLFDRSKQRAELTPAGRLVLEQGREILLSTSRMIDSVKQLESGWESEIRLARDTVIPQEPLFDLVSEFNNLEHNVDISLGVEVLGGGWDALHSQRADIVIGASGELPKGLYQTHRIGSLPFVFAVAPHHPLADFPNTIGPEQLKEHTSVIVSDTSQLLPVRDTGLFQSKRTIRVSSMQEKRQAQVQGLGVGYLPLHIAKPDLESGSLIERPCSIPRPPQELYLAWHKDQDGQAFHWFIDKLCQINWGISG